MNIFTDVLLTFMKMMQTQGWSMTYIQTPLFERFVITPPIGSTLTFSDPRVAMAEVRLYIDHPEDTTFATTEGSNEEWVEWIEFELYCDWGLGGDE